MIILGVILLVLGLLLGFSILYTIGAILLAIGLVLALVGGPFHHPVGGRAHWF